MLTEIHTMFSIFLGIDISKEKVNLCVRSNGSIFNESEVQNSESAITKELRRIIKLVCNGAPQQLLVCAEYTGMYIYPLACACKEMNVFLWIEDPTRIKYSFGLTRGKNDKIDARRISEYAFRFQDKSTQYAIPDDIYMSLKGLLAEKALLQSDRKKYEAQLSDQRRYMPKNDFDSKKGRLLTIIACLKVQIKEIDGMISEIISSNEKLQHQVELLTSIDGIGETIAINMLSITNGFTRFQSPRQFNCYAGLAPFSYTSGNSIHSRSRVSQRANKSIKSLLHLAALCAATHMKESEFRSYYDRRINEGKHPMCVLNIIRAKMISRMFAVIKKDQPYSKVLKYDNYFEIS